MNAIREERDRLRRRVRLQVTYVTTSSVLLILGPSRAYPSVQPARSPMQNFRTWKPEFLACFSVGRLVTKQFDI